MAGMEEGAAGAEVVQPHSLKAAAEVPAGLEYVGGFCGGIIADYRRRFPTYKADWTTDALSLKTLSGSLFLFFATFTSTVALGKHIDDITNGVIGINEYLIMNSVAGMLHSVFGCQPLLVLRPTGPITLLFEKLLEVAEWLHQPFWPFFAWTGIFVGILMFLIAAFELSRFIKYLGVFTENIFACFIGTVYMNDGVQGMIRVWNSTEQDKAARTLLTLNLAVGCTAFAVWLSNMKSTNLGTAQLRGLLVDYALTIALIILVAVAALLNNHFFPVDFIDTTSLGFATTDERSWVANLGGIGAEGVGAAFVAAFPVVMFFYLDQNISSIICQKPEMKLGKGSYYHSSFACMALFCALGPLFGLPFVTGSLPHSPQFVQALGETNEKHEVTGVKESRVTPFIGYFLIGLALLAPDALRHLPETAVSGALIFVGLKAVQSTETYERILLMFTDPSHYPTGKNYSGLPKAKVHLFTAFQLLMVVGCWLCNIFIGLAFPIFVVCLVPIRYKLLPLLFTKEVLDHLLSEGAPEKVEEGSRSAN